MGRRWGVAALVLLAGAGSASRAEADWFKGNTHCHSERSSDGEVPLEELLGWYKDNGYGFIVLTDHNVFTAAEELATLERFDEGQGRMAPLVDAGFLVFGGEEVTLPRHHTNGLDLREHVAPRATIEANVEGIWEAGGLAQLNHPEYVQMSGWDVLVELGFAAQEPAPLLLEVWNAGVPYLPDGFAVMMDVAWDALLTLGVRAWGVAVDDAHTLAWGRSPPGGGYIYVEADALTPEAIRAGLEAGRFYASSGATLDDFGWTADYYEVDAPGATEITFIGRGGAVLEVAPGDYGAYRFQGGEGYVRARVRSPQGLAWTQPVFLEDLPPNAPPEAVIEGPPRSLRVGELSRWSGEGSRDEEGEVVAWRWEFGDGEVWRGEVVEHAWDEPGRYPVVLTVLDAAGGVGRAEVEVEVVRSVVASPSPSGCQATPGVSGAGWAGAAWLAAAWMLRRR